MNAATNPDLTVRAARVTTAAQLVLDRLREVGWTQGVSNEGNGECLINAACWALSHRPYSYDALINAMADRGIHDRVAWNDAEGRTWENVQDLLISLGAQ